MEQQNQTQIQRQTAFKIPIVAIIKSQFVEQEGWNPNYLEIKGNHVARINLIAVVIDKQVSDSLATLTLDDSTGVIQAKVFNEDVKKVIDINIGDPVLLIGKPRKYNEQMFLALEIIKKVDPLWIKIRRKELEKEFDFNENKSHEEANPSLNRSGEKILELIKSLDAYNGADINEVISKSNMQESEASQLIKELIKLGEVYEPQPNKIKIL
ncbi:OB-fold nucleic acid binding domain-containing protein [Candidatus Woesearchaeota archaeon]|nr:OB-fold nucleic acid binding domain-containing protein [Candidatus Woesearchaeota archaeon]